uniref:T9SS type A sorting domain-containing protein n=1 Tax=Maribellus sediminis TaxID=2696285 RepID=UPI0014300210
EGTCIESRVYTFMITDDCGNTDVETTTLTRHYDVQAPVITIDQYAEELCNMAPGTLTASWTDNCSEGGNLTAEPVLFESPDCERIWKYTFTAIDDCNNRTDSVIYVTEKWDQTGGCETAFGRLPNDEDVICFIDYASNDNGKPLFNRWGWTNNITDQEEHVMNLYAGAAHCDITDRDPVGVVKVTWDGTRVHVVYEMEPGQYLSEIHVYVGEDPIPTMSKGKKPKLTVAPGQYTITDEDLIINNGADFWIEDVNYDNGFWIIAHGVVCELTCACSEEYPQFGGVEEQTAYAAAGRVKKSGELATEVSTLELGELKVYPNPFDEVVNIEFVSPVDGHAVLEIYNMVGQRVVRLLDDYIEAGVENKVQFRPESEVSGFYMYKLDIDGDIQIGKMIYRRE